MNHEQYNSQEDIPEQAKADSPKPSLGEQHRGTIDGIFLNSRGVRSGWRLLIFAAIIYVCFQVVSVIWARFARPGPISPTSMLVQEGIFLIVVLAAAGLMAIFEKRSLADYFLPWRREAFGSGFWRGVVWGWLALSVLLVAIHLDHGFIFGHVALAVSKIPIDALLWALAFTLVGLSEEFTFRGYALYTLSAGIGFWPAAILLSGAFGAVHLSNPGEDWAGALAACFIGLFFCFTVRRTGNLWFAIGLHSMWDYAETFLYSVPNSGLMAKGRLLTSSFHGPRWLTGGRVGPEGSVFVFVVIGILFLAFHRIYPRAQFPPPPPAGA
ncbi:MAG TPA: type II CAAX endopeptidase family protein [Terriglobia bacterium]|nr:type II CAAX endopeptidase family protein [Terriglobia bacterium]